MNFLKRIFKPKPFNPYKDFGEEGLKELVNTFYFIMENDQEAKDCLALHPLIEGKAKEETKTKLFQFLSGWTGGPQLFFQNHGHPRMRARHLPFKIGKEESRQWLYCMQKALRLNSKKMSKKNRRLMLNSFTALALRIQNQE